jgi:DNA-directed RNA polymerase specialized sigma24 family protein
VAPPSFEQLFLDVHDRRYRALYFITGSSADAEEIQDAFLKLLERRDRIDRIDDPVAYLFRSALNGFRNAMRRTRTAARKLMPVASTRDPFDDVNVREDVSRMLRGLPPPPARGDRSSPRSSATAAEWLDNDTLIVAP